MKKSSLLGKGWKRYYPPQKSSPVQSSPDFPTGQRDGPDFTGEESN